MCPHCRNTYPDDYKACPRDSQLLVEAFAKIDVGSILRGKYEVLGELGAGGMATVYKVRHLAFHQVSALKLVHPQFLADTDFLKRFRNEAVVAWQLKHPNAVRIDDLDLTEDGRPFIVMEYIEGATLQEVRAQRPGAWPVGRSLAITAQVAAALAAAHALGIVHRDIKPSNVLLTTGSDLQALVKVMDFGIAKTGDRAFKGMTSVMTSAGMIIGTPEYMSPEQASGGAETGIDARSDLYSLGLVLYEMVTGGHPFRADTPMGMLIEQLHTTPRSPMMMNTDVSPAVSALISKSLEKSPSNRFQSAMEMLEAVRDPEAWWRTNHVSATQPPSFEGNELPLTAQVPNKVAEPIALNSANGTVIEDVAALDLNESNPDAEPTRIRTSRNGMRFGILGAAIVFLLVVSEFFWLRHSSSWTANLTAARDQTTTVATVPSLANSGTLPALKLSATPSGDPVDAEYLKGVELERAGNRKAAAPLFSSICSGGDVRGCVALGQELMAGSEKDYSKAQTLLRKGCDGGNASGCIGIGTMYEDGMGVEQNEETALSFYRKACHQGGARGCDKAKQLQASMTHSIEVPVTPIAGGEVRCKVVFGSNSKPVPQLTVHLINTSSEPPINLIQTTDAQGTVDFDNVLPKAGYTLAVYDPTGKMIGADTMFAVTETSGHVCTPNIDIRRMLARR